MLEHDRKTVRVKTSLVHTSNFATLEDYNFPRKNINTSNLQLVEQTSLHDC